MGTLSIARVLPTPTWNLLRQLLPAPALHIWDGLLLAVPKKKTTHSKKRMRMAGKYLKPDNSMRRCPVCGTWKRAHFYCHPCPGAPPA